MCYCRFGVVIEISGCTLYVDMINNLYTIHAFYSNTCDRHLALYNNMILVFDLVNQLVIIMTGIVCLYKGSQAIV